MLMSLRAILCPLLEPLRLRCVLVLVAGPDVLLHLLGHAKELDVPDSKDQIVDLEVEHFVVPFKSVDTLAVVTHFLECSDLEGTKLSIEYTPLYFNAFGQQWTGK